MLLLNHVDARNFVPLHLSVPGTTPNVGASASFDVKLFPLVEAYTIWVCFDVVEGFSLG